MDPLQKVLQETLANALRDAVREAVREAIRLELPRALNQAQRRWVSARELAGLLGVTVRTVRNWQQRGLLPYHKQGRAVRFDLREVEQVLAERKVPAAFQYESAGDGSAGAF